MHVHCIILFIDIDLTLSSLKRGTNVFTYAIRKRCKLIVHDDDYRMCMYVVLHIDVSPDLGLTSTFFILHNCIKFKISIIYQIYIIDSIL